MLSSKDTGPLCGLFFNLQPKSNLFYKCIYPPNSMPNHNFMSVFDPCVFSIDLSSVYFNLVYLQRIKTR